MLIAHHCQQYEGDGLKGQRCLLGTTLAPLSANSTTVTPCLTNTSATTESKIQIQIKIKRQIQIHIFVKIERQ